MPCSRIDGVRLGLERNGLGEEQHRLSPGHGLHPLDHGRERPQRFGGPLPPRETIGTRPFSAALRRRHVTLETLGAPGSDDGGPHAALQGADVPRERHHGVQRPIDDEHAHELVRSLLLLQVDAGCLVCRGASLRSEFMKDEGDEGGVPVAADEPGLDAGSPRAALGPGASRRGGSNNSIV